MNKLFEYNCGCRIWFVIGDKPEFLAMCYKHAKQLKENHLQEIKIR